MTLEFQEFEKIARLNREVIVTEKIDGTNGQVHIRLAEGSSPEVGYDTTVEFKGVLYFVRAGSRSRWITPFGVDDNFGFSKWVQAHAEELAELGPGAHFGEWWGSGIQRRYSLQEKRWSLFNVGRWVQLGREPLGEKQAYAPACCHVVPILAEGVGMHHVIEHALERLRSGGSVASPGFMKPEGIVAFHTHSRTLFKVTLERDEEPKSMRKSA
jgi:hypothetical protein